MEFRGWTIFFMLIALFDTNPEIWLWLALLVEGWADKEYKD